MDLVHMEHIREGLEFFSQRISDLTGNESEIQSTWSSLQENIVSMHQLLVKERTDRIKEKEKMEEARKLEREQWMAMEMRMVSHVESLKADLRIKHRELVTARTTLMVGESSQGREIENIKEAAQELKNERVKSHELQLSNTALRTQLRELEQDYQEMEDELMEKDDVIAKITKEWKSAKCRIQKVIGISNEVRSKNLESNARYKAMLAQKMEREREMIKDPINALEREINRREAEILSAVSVVAVQKQRLMQELKNKYTSAREDGILSGIPVMIIRKQRLMEELKERHIENMSKKERKEWKKMQKKMEKEAKKQKKTEEKRKKEQQRAMREERENNQERRSFWRRLQFWRT